MSNTVMILLFMDTNFRGLRENDQFFDSWIHGFETPSNKWMGHFVFVGNQIVYQPTNTMITGTPQTKIFSQDLHLGTTVIPWTLQQLKEKIK